MALDPSRIRALAEQEDDAPPMTAGQADTLKRLFRAADALEAV